MEMIEAIEARLVEPSSDAPKYVVLRDAIVGAISSGDWIPGMRLPTEAELAQTLPYSLGTVQKAYGELVRNGLVVRSRGRGSFVASTQRQMADPWHCRFLADDGTILPIYPRLIGREFDIVSRFYTSNAIAKPLVRLPRDKVETANFKAILLQELGMPIVRVTQTVESANAPASRELQMKERPRLVIKATAYTIGGDTVYFQEFYIPANQRRLLFDSELKY